MVIAIAIVLDGFFLDGFLGDIEIEDPGIAGEGHGTDFDGVERAAGISIGDLCEKPESFVGGSHPCFRESAFRIRKGGLEELGDFFAGEGFEFEDLAP